MQSSELTVTPRPCSQPSVCPSPASHRGVPTPSEPRVSPGFRSLWTWSQPSLPPGSMGLLLSCAHVATGGPWQRAGAYLEGPEGPNAVGRPRFTPFLTASCSPQASPENRSSNRTETPCSIASERRSHYLQPFGPQARGVRGALGLQWAVEKNTHPDKLVMVSPHSGGHGGMEKGNSPPHPFPC